jgi:SAM-dependent methyltransferase
MHTDVSAPSSWLVRWSHLIPAQAQVLDLACGSGRHMQWLQSQGYSVLGVDRDEAALRMAQHFGDVLCADVENAAWPLTHRQFDAVVVTNYLWRPTWPLLLACLKTDGVLIYETFAAGNESVGKPSRPDFLLERGELLQRCQGLRIVAYEDVFLTNPDRFVQRIVAVNTDHNHKRFASSPTTAEKS